MKDGDSDDDDDTGIPTLVYKDVQLEYEDVLVEYDEAENSMCTV